MRTLKDGTVKFKPSAVAAAERMAQNPTPLPIYRRNTTVRVFMGAGWQQGAVVDSTKERCVVELIKVRRSVTVYDSRNITEQSPK
jgi:hypothetical protein